MGSICYLGMESTNPQSRALLAVADTFGWVMGMIVLPIFPHFIHDWRQLQFALSLSTIPMLVMAWYAPNCTFPDCQVSFFIILLGTNLEDSCNFQVCGRITPVAHRNAQARPCQSRSRKNPGTQWNTGVPGQRERRA